MSWRTPHDLVAIGFDHSRVVMMNEGHNGMARCPRTRRTGRAILEVAHSRGCRFLAMEAICNRGPGPTFATAVEREGYLAQPELGGLVDAALALGWTLVGYECIGALAPDAMRADPMGIAFTNWREQQQAANLIAALTRIPDDERMLVWCGNAHHSKVVHGDWVPMGAHVTAHAPAFCIDQLATVSLAAEHRPQYTLSTELRATLDALGGTAGFTREDPPTGFCVSGGWDALVFSTDNAVI
jgi:hypothetical protein